MYHNNIAQMNISVYYLRYTNVLDLDLDNILCTVNTKISRAEIDSFV